ncbi:MAG: ATP-binding protein [Anaerolineales bacterium]
MRLKLFLSFSVIILITVTSVVLIVRQNTAREVHEYMFRGGMMGLNAVVNDLEQCYQETQTWGSCTPYLQTGNHPENMSGRMQGGRIGRGPPNASAVEQTSERRKALTADIAHELRTPLSVQQAHLEALEDGIYVLTIENLRPFHEQNQTLVRLVDDLRTLALADSGELTLERTRTDFAQLAERVIDRYHPKSKEKDVEIQFAPPERSIIAHIDPQRVEQIITNLLSNVLRHSPQGETIEVNLVPQEEQLSLAIRDRGEGIPEDEIPFIFDRFYKSDKTRHKEDGGTGLGLSISQKLAQAHGGSIQPGIIPVAVLCFN